MPCFLTLSIKEIVKWSYPLRWRAFLLILRKTGLKQAHRWYITLSEDFYIL
jgi:hypothetical protein